MAAYMLAEPLRLHVPFPCHRLFFITPSSLIHDFLLVNLVFKFLVNTILMDQEHMITIEDTDAAIKRCEQHLQRAATDEGSPNTHTEEPGKTGAPCVKVPGSSRVPQ